MLNEDKIRLKGVNLFVLAVSKNAICEEEEKLWNNIFQLEANKFARDFTYY